MEAASDRDLVLQTRRGDLEAFGTLVRRYQQSVFNVCYRLLGDRHEAEDLTQETFIRVYRRLDTFDVERPFGPWVRRIATNLCLNQLQHRQTHWHLEDERSLASEQETDTPESRLERREAHERLRAAILALPPHYRAVIELRHFQGLRYEEIAKTLGISIGQVKVHLFRARKQLARRLQDDE